MIHRHFRRRDMAAMRAHKLHQFFTFAILLIPPCLMLPSCLRENKRDKMFDPPQTSSIREMATH